MARSVLLALAAALLLAGCGGGSSSTPVAAPVLPSVVPGDFRCPDPTERPEKVADHGSPTLPTGARAARLCLLDNHLQWTPPRGVLTTGLDDLVGVVDAQQVYDPDPNTGCGGVGAPAWSLVFRYGGGGTRTITGDNGGCWDLLVGGVQHLGSRHVFDAYVRAVLAQRRSHGVPETSRTPPACPDDIYPAVSPAGDVRTIASAVWCHRSGRRYVAVHPVSAVQLAGLRHDLRTAAPRHVPPRRAAERTGCRVLPRSTSAVLMGRDAWGDAVAVAYGCDTYLAVPARRPLHAYVRMLPATVAIVAALERR